MIIMETLYNADEQKCRTVTGPVSPQTRGGCLSFGAGKIGSDQILKLEKVWIGIFRNCYFFPLLELSQIICLESKKKRKKIKSVLEQHFIGQSAVHTHPGTVCYHWSQGGNVFFFPGSKVFSGSWDVLAVTLRWCYNLMFLNYLLQTWVFVLCVPMENPFRTLAPLLNGS